MNIQPYLIKELERDCEQLERKLQLQRRFNALLVQYIGKAETRLLLLQHQKALKVRASDGGMI